MEGTRPANSIPQRAFAHKGTTRSLKSKSLLLEKSGGNHGESLKSLNELKEKYLANEGQGDQSKGKSSSGSTLQTHQNKSRPEGLSKAQSAAALKMVPDHPG